MLTPLFLKLALYTISFVISVASARIVGIEDLGRFTVVFSLVGILTVVFNCGIDTTIIRVFSSSEKIGKRLNIGIVLGDRIISLFFLYPVFIVLSYIILNDFMLSILSSTLTFMVIFRNTASNYLNAKKLYVKGIFFQEGIQSVVRLSFLLGTLLLLTFDIVDSRIEYLYFSWFIGVFVSTFFLYLFIQDDIEITLNFYGFFDRFRNILNESVSYWVSQIVWLCSPFLDIILISYILNVSDVSGYDTAAKIASAGVFFSSITQTVIAPQISSLWDSCKISELKRFLRKVTFFFFSLSLISLMVFVFFGKDFLSIWGEEFKDYYNILVIISVAQMVKMTFGVLTSLLQMSGYAKVEMRIALVSIPLRIVMSVFLGFSIGVEGFAISILISTIIVNVTLYIFSRKLLFN